MSNSNYKYSVLTQKEFIKLQSEIKSQDINLIESAKAYKVTKNNKLVAIFEIINVLDVYNKTLKIDIFPKNIKSDGVSPKDILNSVRIYRFIFHSILEITENEKLEKFKIHSQEKITALIFTDFAKILKEDFQDKYQVRFYRNWVEVLIVKNNKKKKKGK